MELPPVAQSVRNCRRNRFDPWVWKILWRRAWQPTLVFLPGKSHGQRSLAGSYKESDTTEATWQACTHGSETSKSCHCTFPVLGYIAPRVLHVLNTSTCSHEVEVTLLSHIHLGIGVRAVKRWSGKKKACGERIHSARQRLWFHYRW